MHTLALRGSLLAGVPLWEYLTVGNTARARSRSICEAKGRGGRSAVQERNGRSVGEASAIPLSPPSPDEVRAQLARILGSPEFVVPERSRGFLRYVVEETLAGRAERLKGYTIAVEVFERDASFDAQADPVVRIEAGRLRRALERYYLVAGQADPVLIEIPKGGYVPVFSRRAVRRAESPAVEDAACGDRSSARVRRSGRGGPLRLGLPGLAALAVGPRLAARFARASGNPRPARAAAPDGPTLLVVPFDEPRRRGRGEALRRRPDRRDPDPARTVQGADGARPRDSRSSRRPPIRLDRPRAWRPLRAEGSVRVRGPSCG